MMSLSSIGKCAVVAIVSACIALGAAACSDPMGEALSLEKNGDWQGAIGIYERVLAADPEDGGALSGMATALWLLGRYDEALTFQERVVSADLDDLQTRVELAFNYLNHQGRAADAVSVLEQAVGLERSARILTFLGQAEREAGDLKEAETTFKEAISVDSSYGYAYYQLLRLLEQQGRGQEAAAVREDAADNGVNLTENP